MSIQKKLLMVTALPLIIILLLVVFLTEYRMKNNMIAGAENLVHSIAETAEFELMQYLIVYRTSMEGIAATIATLEDNFHENEDIDRETMLIMLESTMASKDISVATLYFMRNAVNEGLPEEEFYIFNTGREYRRASMQRTNERLWYNGVIINGKTTITAPYLFDRNTMAYLSNPSSADFKNPNNIYAMSIAVPIVTQNKGVIGAVVAEVLAPTFASILQPVKPFGTGYAALLGTDGSFLYTPRADLIGTSFVDVPYKDFIGITTREIANAFMAGEKTLTADWWHKDLKTNMYFIYRAVYIGDNVEPLALAVNFDKSDMPGFPVCRGFSFTK